MKYLLVCLLVSLSVAAALWDELERADKFEVIPIRVALKQQNLDILEVHK
jgi:hypothetical protein